MTSSASSSSINTTAAPAPAPPPQQPPPPTLDAVGVGLGRPRRAVKRVLSNDDDDESSPTGRDSSVPAALPHNMSVTSLASAASEGCDDDDDGEGGGKKARFVWSPEVHACFCEAVHKLGVDKAKPQAIARLMQGDMSMSAPNMPTRQNIKSHLQKYRLLLTKRREQDGPRASHPPGGFHEMPSHANRAAAARQQANAASRRNGGYGHGRGGRNAAQHDPSNSVVHIDSSSVDVFGNVMGEHDADDAAAFEAFDLADIAAPNATFDFSHLGGTSIQAGGLAGSGGVHRTLSGLPMNHLSPQGGLTGSSGSSLGRRTGGGMTALGSQSPIQAPHASFQIGGVGAHKRARGDDSLSSSVLAAAGLTTGGLTQGVLKVGTGSSDEDNEQGGFGGISSFLAGSDGSIGSIGHGSDDGQNGRPGSDGGSGSVGRGSSASPNEHGTPPEQPDWFSM